MIEAPAEHSRSAACFGGTVSIHAAGDGAEGLVEQALGLLAEHDRRLSRFRPQSELSQLNRSRERAVRTSPLVTDLAVAVIEAGRLSGGLVDATVLPSLRAAGYAASLDPEMLDATDPMLFTRSSKRPASPGSGWSAIRVLPHLETVVRPPGLEIDSGGLGKGMAADAAGRLLETTDAFCVDCGGDMVVGGTAGSGREVLIPNPLLEAPPVSLRLAQGAVATSGVTRRSWIDSGGGLAHHLIDPGVGRPAFTGILQATALAPSGLEAEVRAKAALLAGPAKAAEHLPHGGVLFTDSGEELRVPARGERS